MDHDSLAELRRLQARAYGPDGDIHEDPEALLRLAELQAYAASIDDARTEITDDAEAAPIDVEALAEPLVEPPVSADADADAAPVRRSAWRRWMPWAWLASLVAVAAVAAVWTLTTMVVVLTPIDAGAGARQVAVIQSDPGFVTPAFFGTTEFEPTGFQDFHGLTLVASTGDWFGGSSDDRCLWLMRTEDIDPEAEFVNGPVYTDCSAGGFPASIELVVTAELPAELRERFPEGTALQFILDADRVGVFTDGG